MNILLFPLPKERGNRFKYPVFGVGRHHPGGRGSNGRIGVFDGAGMRAGP